LALLGDFLFLKVLHLLFESVVECRQVIQPMLFFGPCLFKARLPFLLPACSLLVDDDLLGLVVRLLIRLLKQAVVVLNVTILEALHEVVKNHLDLPLHFDAGGSLVRWRSRLGFHILIRNLGSGLGGLQLWLKRHWVLRSDMWLSVGTATESTVEQL